MTWWVYIVVKNGKLYAGITTDMENRMRQHGNPPILYREGPMSRSEAASREKQMKGWSREKKLRLLQNKPGMSA
jgi:predicted GIY-YIG superfamily endonuclease